MAENKYFLVTDKTTQYQTVAGAPNRGIAISLAAGNEGGFKIATNREVADYFAAGDKKVHASSTPTGKYFISGDAAAPVLIRAKNAGAAFAAVNADRFDIEQLKTDKLVDLLSAGVKQVRYEAPAGKDATDDGSDDADDDQGDAGAAEADAPAEPVVAEQQDAFAAKESTQDADAEAQAA